MATTEDYLAAANVPPSERTREQRDLVSRGSNILDVKNANFHATERERTGR